MKLKLNLKTWVTFGKERKTDIPSTENDKGKSTQAKQDHILVGKRDNKSKKTENMYQGIPFGIGWGQCSP